MIGTILLAGGLFLAGLLSGTYLLVQRKIQTLDEEAFRVWFMRAFLGMSSGTIRESMQEPESEEARRKGRNTQRRPRAAKSETRDQVQARPA